MTFMFPLIKRANWRLYRPQTLLSGGSPSPTVALWVYNSVKRVSHVAKMALQKFISHFMFLSELFTLLTVEINQRSWVGFNEGTLCFYPRPLCQQCLLLIRRVTSFGITVREGLWKYCAYKKQVASQLAVKVERWSPLVPELNFLFNCYVSLWDIEEVPSKLYKVWITSSVLYSNAL